MSRSMGPRRPGGSGTWNGSERRYGGYLARSEKMYNTGCTGPAIVESVIKNGFGAVKWDMMGYPALLGRRVTHVRD